MLIKIEGHRWAIEDNFETAKNELGLDKILEPNDVADAFAVALCHYHTARALPMRECG